jgi:cell division protein FtsQ
MGQWQDDDLHESGFIKSEDDRDRMRPVTLSARRPARTVNRRVPRQNISRRAVANRRRTWLRRLAAAVWLAVGAAATIFASLFFIFVHDVFVQSEHFQTREIHVEGGRRLSTKVIMAQAGVRPGVNVLSVNLAAARKRLLAHPWIAEAEIQRDIPSTLRIRIREHVAAAVVDIGRKFLLNPQGSLFKEWESSDPNDLPAVAGLAIADLRGVDRSSAAGNLPFFESGAAVPPPFFPSRPMDAVLQVLTLGREPGSILPTQELRSIRVDRELGLTLVAYAENRAIRLGYNDYPAKYHLLRDLLAFFRTQPNVADFERIDLTDMNRVIVHPVRAELPKKTGPQGG